ncbi:MAG: Wzz/FepE/Etk N-terminal domain-containing protein [Candidatus Euphemobacter frigidus]|nr:Wzz/FepE/Etk N-terminal domain-containing protein [Candidatus Euphemobacter frigidus]MDP8276825.1 Wzz/FepE/Etk N-terminal domain-containing protein [Candidatus Euphemobacter frigidus]
MSNVNEIRILKVLYKHKIKLLLVTLAVGVIVAVINLLSSNIYSSTAAISVQPPGVPLTGEVPPLNVETLRSLVESTRVKWELFQELKERGVLDEKMTFLRFQKILSSSVEQDKTRERKLLPMVKLTATTRDPELSMVIANQWAEVVLKKTKAIYQSGVDELGTFTSNIYEKVSKSLLESEGRYTKKLLESNLSVNKMLLEHNEELFSQLSAEVLQLEEEVATKTALINKLGESLAAQEVDGIWVGEIYARKYSEDKKYVLPLSNPLPERICRTIRALDKNEETLARFDESSRINYKSQMLKIKKTQIEDISGEIMQARTSLFSIEPTYNKLKEELAEIKPKIILSKAMGDDIFWTSYIQGNLPNSDKAPSLKTESSNPVYQAASQELIKLSAEVYGLKSKFSEGKKELEELRKEVSSLTLELVPLKSRRVVLYAAVKKERSLLAYYETSYNTGRQEYEVGEKELIEADVKLAAKKSKLDLVGKEISALEKSVFTSENEIEGQKRDVENLTKVRAELAGKAEEVALLRVTMENVSRSGTVLLYKAQADPAKVGPRRTRTVLISMLTAFLLVSLLLVLNAVVRER